ncbi:DUF4249 domain-containing protein [Gramella lutea]|uniref:DUF4249 domain-containing protein n=1 Tax=Christiangramia lutea TaxID=1607951 RepID=A0A9X2AAP5_9FLAO|nr:DUF4249 domain-containing protein [Christiangramia lutea]MCH4822283.1 DUF4249 domain-containing protein [Christiangramia lutea]
MKSIEAFINSSKSLRYMPVKVMIGLISMLFLNSCVDEIELDSQNFESYLVIEGIITDQEEFQEIKLTRSYDLEDNEPSVVGNASVEVNSSNGATFRFERNSDGVYISETPFSAQPGIEYVLEITTPEGTYESSAAIGQEPTLIDNISSTLTEIREETGVAILVSSSDENQGSYYKYEFEETYKIVSRYRILNDLIINEEDEFEVVPKANEEYICYNTLPSQELVLSNTADLTGSNINNYLVRFLSKEDSKLAHRYSILVKQLKISAEAHAFYTTLKNLSESENIFSQYQPGFLDGNIQSVTNSGERVIGFFTTAAVDEQRLFFSYTDYFDPIEEPRPQHYGPCEPFTPEDRNYLRELVESNQVELFGEDPPGVYSVIAARCVNCNYFGTNVQPEFWTE